MSQPIRFQCACGQQLQVPEAMAGRKGRCPRCGAAIDVPAASGTVARTIGPALPPPPPRVPPRSPAPPAVDHGTKVCPFCAESIQAAARRCRHCGEWIPEEKPVGSVATRDVEGSGPPWEDPAAGTGSTRMFETAKEFVADPAGAYRRMRRRGGLAAPFLFTFLIQLGVGVVTLGEQVLFQLMFAGGHADAGLMIGSTLLQGGLTILAGATIGPFFMAGVFHLCVMLVGGRGDFESTFRVYCYGPGSITPVQIVPFLGGLIGGLWGLVLVAFGLQEVHAISGGRAAVAVLLPVVFLVGLVISCVVLFFVLVAPQFGGIPR